MATGSRIARIPYAIYVREYIRDTPLHRNILSRANRVIAVSRDVQDYVRNLISPDRTVVCYDPINAQPIEERMKRHPAGGERLLPFSIIEPVIGLVGRITPYKQPHLFVQSIPEVLKVVPEARFVIVGSASPKEKNYETWVRGLPVELGVENKIAFLGARSDAVELISEMKIFCVTSSREPFARVILEAQVIGCPVIAPNTGGPPEAIQDGETGLLFSSTAPDSPIQLATKIIKLLQDENLRMNLAIRARQQVYQTYAGHLPVKKLENELEKLSSKGSLV